MAKSLKWVSVERIPLSQVDVLESEMQDIQILSTFRKEWEQEFLETSFSAFEITAFCVLFGTYCILNFLFRVFIESGDGAGGGFAWIFCTWFPQLISATICFGIFALKIPAVLRFAKPHYDKLAGLIIIASYLAVVIPTMLLEIRRSEYSTSAMATRIDFSSIPPKRTCSATSVQNTTSDIDCSNLVLSSQVYVICLLLNLLPRMFCTGPKTAMFVSFATAIFLFLALFFVGSVPGDWATLLALVLQLLVGLCFASFCTSKQRSTREEFALNKRIRYATEQSRSLLDTLIPSSVVEKRSQHVGDELLGAAIPSCAIMFCALEPHAELQAAASPSDFALLDTVFSALDRAVADSGMFKYQHVG